MPEMKGVKYLVLHSATGRLAHHKCVGKNYLGPRNIVFSLQTGHISVVPEIWKTFPKNTHFVKLHYNFPSAKK